MSDHPVAGKSRRDIKGRALAAAPRCAVPRGEGAREGKDKAPLPGRAARNVNTRYWLESARPRNAVMAPDN